ncbi:hypothetical protein [Streptomyces fagopyri]
MALGEFRLAQQVADLTDELLDRFETSRRLEDELRDLLGRL